MAKINQIFDIGNKVRRRNLTNGNPPVYRFAGTVVGTYVNPVNDQAGCVVSNNHEPGLIQIFPEYMLELDCEATAEQAQSRYHSDNVRIFDEGHQAYWRPKRRGYTMHKQAAGHYSRREATTIVEAYPERKFRIEEI